MVDQWAEKKASRAGYLVDSMVDQKVAP